MNKTGATCFSCGRSEDDVPVILLRLTGNEVFICPQCLPALIHHPDRLSDKLVGLASTPGAPPCDH